MSNTPATPTTEIVLAWFYANYQDAVHSVFYDGRDGGYQYAPGAGPCDPLEVLREQLSRCTQIPEYARIGCFAALKPWNLPGCLYSKAGINLLQRKGIRSIWQLNPGRTSDGTLSGI
jgi:hypothetical protein